ncbi:high frequency lysogenization protein [Pasteurella langaaensis DSM 22999]|uniref:High frequency lysogenization protein HflD homolog n=1 Tax=Alitibacter langaaensis DSM 22999 TaxID=1122935 RepID=A0A2U0SM73_9PAST|nr:high frequency lysogenization protein HflD [Pasteurella langaaensis]PVX32422.1 high frequency lysogenization protein [Pasteurella langaaensis DSM 22999]
MANDYDQIVLSLAGVCQSAKLVQQLAHNGQADLDAFETSLSSLLQTHPESAIAVYGGDAGNLKLGLATLLEQLEGKNVELARYWLGLLALAGKLAKNPEAKSELARRIQYLPTQLEFHDLFDDEIIAIIAAMYTDLVSPLGKRLLVQGKPLYLSQENIQNRVRACLLAGIRSALLWQQVGGTKWQILFSRRKILNAAQHLYNSL